jgi:hypothetical protein
MKNIAIIVLIPAVGFSSACRPRPKNETQNLPSPSGDYVVRIPIEENTSDPAYKGTGVWKVTILNKAGSEEYKDTDSTMVGNLRIYWGWDVRDQVWVYNSDDGRITRWSKDSGAWVKHEAQDKSGIPAGILPDYAR